MGKMGKNFVVPLIALLGGFVGYALRTWQLRTAFEPESLLPIPASPATWTIVIFSVLMACLFVFLSLPRKQKDHSALLYQQAMQIHSILYLALFLIAGLATLYGAFLYYRGSFSMLQDQPQTNVLQLIFAVVAALAGLSLLFFAFRQYQERKLQYSMTQLILTFSSCLWLMVSYQRWAKDPFTLNYLFILLAIMIGMLAHYFIATYAFGSSRLHFVYLFSSSAIFFSITALANKGPVGERCFLLAQTIYLASCLFLISRNPEKIAQKSEPSQAKTAETPKEDAP